MDMTLSCSMIIQDQLMFASLLVKMCRLFKLHVFFLFHIMCKIENRPKISVGVTSRKILSLSKLKEKENCTISWKHQLHFLVLKIIFKERFNIHAPPCNILYMESSLVANVLFSNMVSSIGRAWLAQLVERQSAVREVKGSSPRPDQHSGVLK